MRPQSAKIISGSEAMACAYRLGGVRISYTFPITPQSEVMECLAQEGLTCIQADSEYNVLAGAEGVLWSGERCAVVTASQGLVLMNEVMWEVAGNRLPLVMGVFNRGLKGPGWCLGAQQNDSLSVRDTGWLQFYCESAQEILDLILISLRVAETVALPILVVGDGFYVSHEREEVWIPEAEDALEFVGQRSVEGLPRAGQPASYGGLVPAEQYFALNRQLHLDVLRSAQVFQEVADEYGRLFGRHYGLVEAHYTADADIVIVAVGTIAGTVREVVEQARQQGQAVGLIKMLAFRPFPAAELLQHLEWCRKIIVLDRNLAPGWGGIFGTEIKTVLFQAGRLLPVCNFITGLGGLDVTPEMVGEAVDYANRVTGLSPPPLFLTEAGVES